MTKQTLEKSIQEEKKSELSSALASMNVTHGRVVGIKAHGKGCRRLRNLPNKTHIHVRTINIPLTTSKH